MTTKLTLFDPLPESEQGTMLARHMPTGVAWQACFDEGTNMGKLVKGLASEFYRLQLLIKTMVDEFNIDKTDDLLPDWEASVGIPDECFTNTETKENRRKQVKLKFTNFGGVQTAADFVRVASEFGLTISIEPPQYVVFPLEFPVRFAADRHTMIVKMESEILGVTFPLLFPAAFTSGNVGFLQCLFEKLVPATTKVIIVVD